MKRQQELRSAFTLVELLVSIGIIAILTGLSLTAVQAVREQARSAACQNNLRQLWLGIASYESSHGHFPSGERNAASNFVSILPFTGYQNMYDSVNFDLSPGDPENLKVLIPGPDYQKCPSDTDTTFFNTGRTSYLASLGTAWLLGEGNGVFSWGATAKSDRIHDGLSNTVALAEFAAGTFSNRLRYLDVHPDSMTVSIFDQMLNDAPATTLDSQIGAEWHYNGLSKCYYTHYLPPGSKSGICQGWVRAAAYSPSSNHPGRTQVCRADGSVSAVPYSIDRVVWVQLGHRSDGGGNPFERVIK